MNTTSDDRGDRGPAFRSPPRRLCRAAHGFTLIEVIVGLMLIAVLSAMLAPLFGTAFTHSADPALGLPVTADLMTIMEDINADYERTYYDDLAGLKTAIDDRADGTTYTVLASDYVTFDPDTGAEQVGGTETDALRVTLKSASGERLTALFPYQIGP